MFCANLEKMKGENIDRFYLVVSFRHQDPFPFMISYYLLPSYPPAPPPPSHPSSSPPKAKAERASAGAKALRDSGIHMVDDAEELEGSANPNRKGGALGEDAQWSSGIDAAIGNLSLGGRGGGGGGGGGEGCINRGLASTAWSIHA